MNVMNRWYAQAAEKLKKEKAGVKGQKELAMAGPVQAALLEFCHQDVEFAQAIVQGGSFPDCMKAVAEGVGGSISDLDAYKRAVSFYFPGAEIRVEMTIDLIGKAAEEKPVAGSNIISLDLADFF